MKTRSLCGHSACSQHFIDTGDVACLFPITNAAEAPSSAEQRAGVHELLTVGDKLIFRLADGRVITIAARNRNRNRLDDALAAVIAFVCGAAVALFVSALLGVLP